MHLFIQIMEIALRARAEISIYISLKTLNVIFYSRKKNLQIKAARPTMSVSKEIAFKYK